MISCSTPALKLLLMERRKTLSKILVFPEALGPIITVTVSEKLKFLVLKFLKFVNLIFSIIPLILTQIHKKARVLLLFLADGAVVCAAASKKNFFNQAF